MGHFEEMMARSRLSPWPGPTTAPENLRKAKGTDSLVAFAVVSDPQRGDVSPMEI